VVRKYSLENMMVSTRVVTFGSAEFAVCWKLTLVGGTVMGFTDHTVVDEG